MVKIGMIGGEESLLGFGVLGVVTRFCRNQEEAEEALLSMADFGIVFITDSLYAMLSEVILRIEKRGHPTLVPLPDRSEALSLGETRIRQNIEKAVGADIIGD